MNNISKISFIFCHALRFFIKKGKKENIDYTECIIAKRLEIFIISLSFNV